VLVGLVFVELGAPEGDAVAALLVAALIAAAATRLISENANVLMDRTPAEAREAAERAIADLGADIELIRLRLRESAGRYFADVVLAVPPGQAVVEGHQAADLVEAAVQRVLPGSDVVVHVEPRSRDLSLRDRVLGIALEEPLVLEAHDIMIFERAGEVSVALHLKLPADRQPAAPPRAALARERACRLPHARRRGRRIARRCACARRRARGAVASACPGYRRRGGAYAAVTARIRVLRCPTR
jgi:hypothetical protein